MNTEKSRLLSELHRFTDIHAHLAPGSVRAPAGVLVSLMPDEAEVIFDSSTAVPGADAEGAYSVGVHPWYADAPVDFVRLEDWLRRPEVMAVGECGLDRLRGPSAEVQERVFRRQIELSEQLRKPMILHVVRAMEPLLRIRREMSPQMPWIWHGFRGGVEQARQLVGAGIALSLGERYNPAVAEAVPPAMLFRETDSAV